MGIILVFFGFIIRITARGYKAEKSPQGNFLITDRIYSLLRHPMYLGTFLIGLGIILVLFRLWLLLFFLLIFLSIYIPQINKEEKKLLVKFGKKYKLYCKKVPKFFPRLSSLFKNPRYFYLLN